MCNPPFYSSEAEIFQLASNKQFTPHAVRPSFPSSFSFARRLTRLILQVCTGAETEMITPGGEVAFVKRMIEESLTSGNRCRFVRAPLVSFPASAPTALTPRYALLSDGSPPSSASAPPSARSSCYCAR